MRDFGNDCGFLAPWARFCVRQTDEELPPHWEYVVSGSLKTKGGD